MESRDANAFDAFMLDEFEVTGAVALKQLQKLAEASA